MLSLFKSKNRKLVEKWEKEHENLVVLGNKVIAEYVKGNKTKTKTYLQQFVDQAMDHLTSEDIEMFKLLRSSNLDDRKIDAMIDDFQRSFKDTKMTLMKFLSMYVKPETELDEEFFDTFQKIMEILAQRIEYEESNLYFQLRLS